MDGILFRFVFLSLLVAVCLRLTRNAEATIFGDIETDFLKIFSDIKQLRSNIPNYGANNVTFEPSAARLLLEEPVNYKRGTIITPRSEPHNKRANEVLRKDFASELLTADFQSRHDDPQHKRHGVGEGLVFLTKPDDTEKRNAVKKKEGTGESDGSNESKPPVPSVLSGGAISNESKDSSANDGADNNRSEKKQSNDSHMYNDTSDGGNNKTSNETIAVQTKETKEVKDQSTESDKTRSSPLVNGTTSGSGSKASRKHKVGRNMIFEARIKGFLAKLAGLKFSDIGKKAKQKEGEQKHQKHEEVSSENMISSKSNNTNPSTIKRTTLDNSSTSVDREEVRKSVTLHKNDTGAGGDDKDHLQQSQLDSSAVGKKKDKIDASLEPECSDNKKCASNKYCRGFECFDCHHKHHECVAHEQCCDGMPCIYGRCDKKPKYGPGTICKNDADCHNGCCVLEPTINIETGICKIKLAEFHQCSPVLYRKVWVGDKKPTCGPCADHLECVNKGVIATHLVCMKKSNSTE